MSESTTPPRAATLAWRRALIPAAVVLPIVVIFALAFGNDPHAVPFVLQNQPAPAIRLNTLDGQPFDVTAVAQGKVVVLNFWASWCEPCKVEHELLQAMSRFYEQDALFVGVIYQDEVEAARRYLQSRTNRFTQLVDPDSKTAIDFGVSGVPETYFVDRAGVVRIKYPGAIHRDALVQTMSSLLGGGG